MSAAVPKKSRLDLIPGNVREEINRWIAKYPPEHKRAAVMAALRLVQEAHANALTAELIEAVAEYLEMPPIAVHEVATFYGMYNLNPVGRHEVCVCTNISCMLCGSDGIAEHLKKKLGVGFGETTTDGRFTLKEVECLGACVGAPMMQVGKTYYEFLTPAKVDQILEQYK